MKSVFVTSFLWWLVGAAVVGAAYVPLVLATDTVLATGTADALDSRIWAALLAAAIMGVMYGVLGALANGGVSAFLRFKPRPLPAATQLVAGVWTIVVTWTLLGASPNLIERIVVTLGLAVVAWLVAPLIYQRYQTKLAPVDNQSGEARIKFVRTHIYTSTPDNDDLQAFVRTSLRGHGAGNALFTVEGGDIGLNTPSTQVLVDSSGTGHALNLAIKSWDDKLADEADQLAGFTVTSDRTLAIAPAGLSAAAVVGQGVAMIQRVSGKADVKVHFDGFGH